MREAAKLRARPRLSLDTLSFLHRGCGATGKPAPRASDRGVCPTSSDTPPVVGRLEEGGERVVLAVLLDEHLEVLVDGGDGEQDARA